jgi:hypothetical protein
MLPEVSGADPASPHCPKTTEPPVLPIKNQNSTIINHQSKESPSHEPTPEISLASFAIPKPLCAGAWRMDLRLMIVEF